VWLVFVLTLWGGDALSETRPEKPCLGATIFPLFDLVRTIGGERFEVIQLLPSGRSEHLFDPAPRDIAKVKKCKAFFAIGLGLDPWVEKLAIASSGKKAASPRIVEVGVAGNPLPFRHTMPEAVRLLEEADSDRSAGGQRRGGAGAEALDPHVWLDPIRWEMVARRVQSELAAIDPVGTKGFSERTADFARLLNAVHLKFGGAAAKWKNSKVVTVHGAYGYFSLRYGVRIPAVLELIPGRQPSAKYMSLALATIRREQVPIVLAEPQIDQRTPRMIASETGARLVTVDPIGGVVPGETWESMMTRFFEVLSGALK